MVEQRLEVPLVENTTITQGANQMTFNLNSADVDFRIESND
ncbi:MAG: hypothetical protein ACI8Q1_000685 [Parvicella sp.]|jgi:hypothetical protein